jgi:DNA polymerase III beta subunit
MKIICDKNTLNDAIQTVSRAVAVKSNLASIEGILFVAENGTLTLTGYDFEMGIKTTFECDVEMEGDIVLSSGLLGNIVKKSTEDKISIDCDARMNCKIKSGMTEYNIKGIDSTDYPDFPSPAQDNSIKIENRLFCEMVDYVIYAVSQDEKRPAHTGVLVKLENRKLTMVALDGYRLAVCEREVDFEGNFSMIVACIEVILCSYRVRELCLYDEGLVLLHEEAADEVAFNELPVVVELLVIADILGGHYLYVHVSILSEELHEYVTVELTCCLITEG